MNEPIELLLDFIEKRNGINNKRNTFLSAEPVQEVLASITDGGWGQPTRGIWGNRVPYPEQIL